MKFRALGRSELQVPVVSFGAWAVGGWLWGGSDDAEAVRAMQHGIDLGVTCIDTAPVYGMGHSERIVGKAIAGRRDQVTVATKCGLRWDLEEGEHHFDTKDINGRPLSIYKNLRPDSIRFECDRSLKRLGIDVIDLYQCHWPDPTTPFEDTIEALLDLRQQGKIRVIGVSNFTPDEMRECLEHGIVASNQSKYNALERHIESSVLPFCRENNIAVLAYSPIAQGLLTGKVGMDREFPPDDIRHAKPMFKTENRRRVLDMLEKVRPLAENHNATLGQLFIAWLVAQPGITSALVGARSQRQVVENAGAGELTLSEKEVKTIRGHVEAVGELN